MAATTPWQNPVRARLARGEFVVGVAITATSLDLAAVAARAGFDFLWIEMEHSPLTLETLRHLVLTSRGLPAVPFARIPIGETWLAKRVLDAGVHGVIVPFTSTPDLAMRAAQACRYPPRGRRGSGAGLATSTWPMVPSYYDSADDNIVVVAIIEEAAAVDQVDAIAATDGIDVLFVGTSDLSFSLGHRGNAQHPEVLAAVAQVRDAAVRHGKVVGRPAATPEALAQYVDDGFLFFQAPSDLSLFAEGARRWLDPIGRAAGAGRLAY
ncbi:MAG: aldolase [Acidobacteria bacterium]|nr:aldolase [Acidobacteriota bacterium]